MELTLTTTQLIVLVAYFLGVYVYKYLITRSNLPVLKELIPAINLIAGVVLGSFGLADFNIVEAVLGTLALGGAADVLSMPRKIGVARTANAGN